MLAGHRADRMFELSPLETARNAVGLLDPGLLEHVPVEPEPDERLGLEPGGQAVERRGVLSMTETSCPALESSCVSKMPTRPHPMMIILTAG